MRVLGSFNDLNEVQSLFPNPNIGDFAYLRYPLGKRQCDVWVAQVEVIKGIPIWVEHQTAGGSTEDHRIWDVNSIFDEIQNDMEQLANKLEFLRTIIREEK